MNRKEYVGYQVYIRSFADSNNDGVGDINGIRQKLPYLKSLGVNLLWITPFYKSPQKDNGYDISDYYKVDKLFGSISDFKKLSNECQKHGIVIMIDLVLNHTSDKHEWFQKALKGDKKYQDYYIFKKNEGKLPTNWQSIFGGSTWEYVKKLDMYYFHIFDKSQPDLNWRNPELRKEISKIVKYWVKLGVKGFRFDAINHISKPKIFVDDNQGQGNRFFTDGNEMHFYIKELMKNSNIQDEKYIKVGEMSFTSYENITKMTKNNRKQLNMVFTFHHLAIDNDGDERWIIKKPKIEDLKKVYFDWQPELQKRDAWIANFLTNHDHPRHLTRFGNGQERNIERAKTLALMYMFLRGTPFIYQGEEIGMINANFNSITQYRDVDTLNFFPILKNKGLSEKEILAIYAWKSRDNSRTPFQWNDQKNSGFSKVSPWIEVSNNYKNINLEKELQTKDSILDFYKKIIDLRKKTEAFKSGKIEMINIAKDVIAYKRIYKKDKYIVICNLSEKDLSYKLNEKAKIIISTSKVTNLKNNLKLEKNQGVIIKEN